MPKLILVKHSQPEIIPEVTAHEWRLSAEGRRRTIPLAARLAAYYPSKIFSSPEPKAYETAAAVGSRLGLPVQVNPRLHEHRRNSVAYLDAAGFQQSMRNFFDHPEERVFGEETAAEARARFSGAVRRLMVQYPRQTIVVVSHGTVISLFSADCCHLEAYEIWKQLALPSFVVIDCETLTVDTIVSRVTARANPRRQPA